MTTTSVSRPPDSYTSKRVALSSRPYTGSYNGERRNCLTCGRRIPKRTAIKGWRISYLALDYCTLKCLRARPAHIPRIEEES